MTVSYEQYKNEDLKKLAFPEENAYQININAIHSALSSSKFLAGLSAQFSAMTEKYAPGRPSLLFGKETIDLELFRKPYTSVIEKIYRTNVLFNKNYPNPPGKDGIIDGANFYNRINDLVRTRLICKYMDGPAFVCAELKKYCADLGIKNRCQPMSTERGYHSWHFYTLHNAEVFINGSVTTIKVEFEIQVTTELAEVLNALTHDLYQAERLQPRDRNEAWKWQPEDPRFRSVFMGHTLHLLEGVILALKNDVVKFASNTEQGDKK